MWPEIIIVAGFGIVIGFWTGACFCSVFNNYRADRLTNQLANIREKLAEIVCVSGEDEGVIYISHESPTTWNRELQRTMYKHRYFSPLGDALIALYKLTSTQEKDCE